MASIAGGATAAATPAAIRAGIRSGARRCAMRLDWLRDSVAAPFEKQGRKLLKRSLGGAQRLYQRHSSTARRRIVDAFSPVTRFARLNAAEDDHALKLLELQRHAMLMYTSCGWFFDELSGIETVQVDSVCRARRAAGQELFGDSLERQFSERLAAAKSNVPEHGDGRRIYDKFVRPAMVDWERVGAHYAVSSLFEHYPEQTKIYCYRSRAKRLPGLQAGLAKMAMGQVKLTSEITWESVVLDFGVLHMGDHNVNGGVQEVLSATRPDEALPARAMEPFMRADFAEVIRLMDRRFGESNYSLCSLFRDEQRKVLEVILTASLGEAETLYRQIYERRAPMMRFLTNLHIPLPKVFYAAAELVLNGYLRQALEQEEVDAERVSALLEAAKLEGVPLDTATLEFAYRHNLERLTERLIAAPQLICWNNWTARRV